MTMTLEQLRDELDGSALGTQERHVLIVDSIEAAIRERDRLRGDVAGMTEELLHVPSRDDWRELQQRAEQAEAELAALKARISEAPVASVRVDDRMHVSIGARSNAVDFVPLHTKHVALVKVED